MKNLAPITVGSYTVNVNVQHAGDTRIAITAVCGKYSLRHIMNHNGAHNQADADFQNVLQQQAQKVATQLAGKIRSEELAKKFTS